MIAAVGLARIIILGRTPFNWFCYRDLRCLLNGQVQDAGPSVSQCSSGVICCLRRSKGIRRASNSSTSLIEDVSVNHGCLDVFMSQEFLNSADVITVFEQMGGETDHPDHARVGARSIGHDCALDFPYRSDLLLVSGQLFDFVGEAIGARSIFLFAHGPAVVDRHDLAGIDGCGLVSGILCAGSLCDEIPLGKPHSHLSRCGRRLLRDHEAAVARSAEQSGSN